MLPRDPHAPADDGAPTVAPGRGRVAIGMAVLALLSFALYARVGGHAFLILDDPGYVEGPVVRNGLSWSGVRWAFLETHSSNWHPLTWLSHMLDVEWFGDDAGKHHLVNAGLHALNAALLLGLLVTLTRRYWPSVAVALLFAVHPQRVESVAWVSERKDVLSGAFFFLTLWAYARHVRRPGAARRAVLLVAFTLGLLAKPMLVTVPFLLLLLDRWPLARWREGLLPPARLVREKVPLFLLAAGSCAATVWAQAEGSAIKPVEELPLAARVSNAALATLDYVRQALWPADLAVLYPHPALTQGAAYRPWSAASLAALAVIAATLVLALRAGHRRPWLPVGVLWYLGMLVPVVGLVQVGGQARADRYTYLPMIGLTLAVVWTLAAWGAAGGVARRRWLGSALALAAVGYGAVTAVYLPLWKDSATLLEHALTVTERNYAVHSNLGVVYLQRGDLDRAIAHLERRLAIQPGTGVLVNLGVAHAQRGDLGRAVELFEEVLRRRPTQFEANLYLGRIHLERGDRARALPSLERAVQAKPHRRDARAALEAARRS